MLTVCAPNSHFKRISLTSFIATNLDLFILIYFFGINGNISSISIIT